jgi:D-arginine dehydrogenase
VPSTACDVLVIGGGIAGVSVACELAATRRVVVLDMEATLAFHTTGRSAAMFLETYGGPVIRALTVASRGAFEREPLLTPMPRLCIARPGRAVAVHELYAATSALIAGVELLTPAEAVGIAPLLRRDRIEFAMLEPDAMEIDVHALHQGYVHGLRGRGATIATSSRIVATEPHDAGWLVRDAEGNAWQAPVVVNAAGAWADTVAELFGARPVGLEPLRRTAFMVDAPPGTCGPLVDDIDEDYYFKPDAGRLLCSPADETLQPPGDARPDEHEIARAIEAINEVTTLDIRHVRSAWAGLRTFAADRTPVVGYDPSVAGLFWCAGQGGYGIQTAPALARTAAALVAGDPLPPDVAAHGVTTAALAADRFT